MHEWSVGTRSNKDNWAKARQQQTSKKLNGDECKNKNDFVFLYEQPIRMSSEFVTADSVV